mgnify:CR=1 FL=1
MTENKKYELGRERELPEEIKKQLVRYEELLQYDNATMSAIDAHRNSLPNRQLINNSSYDTNTINRVYMTSIGQALWGKEEK